MSYFTGPNYTIFCRTNFYNEFKPAGIKRLVPTAINVKYYICPWHFHEPPVPADFTAADLSCEVIPLTPPLFNTDALIADIQAKTYEAPTVIVIQRILPFQREAWAQPPQKS